MIYDEAAVLVLQVHQIRRTICEIFCSEKENILVDHDKVRNIGHSNAILPQFDHFIEVLPRFYRLMQYLRCFYCSKEVSLCITPAV